MLSQDFSFSQLFVPLILLGLILTWAYLLFEIVTSEYKGREGMLWALLVFFVPFVGVLAYLAYGRNSRLKKE